MEVRILLPRQRGKPPRQHGTPAGQHSHASRFRFSFLVYALGFRNFRYPRAWESIQGAQGAPKKLSRHTCRSPSDSQASRPRTLEGAPWNPTATLPAPQGFLSGGRGLVKFEKPCSPNVKQTMKRIKTTKKRYIYT